MGWSRFLRRSRWDEERARELQDYLAHEIDDNIARGMTPQEATHAAGTQDAPADDTDTTEAGELVP